MNPTVSGGTAASWQNVTNSAMQYDVAATGTVTNGTQLISGYYNITNHLGNYINQQIETELSLAATIDGVSDVLVLAAQHMTATGTLVGGINWKEIN